MPARRRRRAAFGLTEGVVILVGLLLGLAFLRWHYGPHGEAAAPPRAQPTAAAPPAVAPPPAPTALPSPTPNPHALSLAWLDAHSPAGVPAISAKAAILVDMERRLVLYANNAHARREQASTTKITTATTVLDLAQPSQSVTVSEAAAGAEPNRMGLSPSEVLTVEELLYGLLLDSGNDAAEALADGIVDRHDFMERMNQKPVSLGLHDTHFVNPSGLPADGQYSSAYDLAVLTSDALSNYPLFRTVVATKEKVIAGNARHKWFNPQNLNPLLWSYPGTIGVKPGYTEDAGYCAVVATQRAGHTLIAVVLGSVNKRQFWDAKLLLDYGFKLLPATEG